MRAGSATGVYAIAVTAVSLVLVVRASASETCAREAFEAVVDEASSVLVTMTQKNTATFQMKLRDLKAKKGWSQEQFLKEGAGYVQDAAITTFDEKSQQLLIRINSQDTATADCRLLQDLKATMSELVDTQNAKWTYMFDKVSKALVN